MSVKTGQAHDHDTLDDVRGPALHAWTTLGAGAREDQLVHPFRGGDRDLLGHEAAEGEAEQVDLLKVESVEEGDGVDGHLLDRVGGRAGRAAHADVVEQDHLTVRGDAVDQDRVPVVDVAAEVLQEHDG